MNLRNYFKDQIHNNQIVTADVESKITYKRVWSGKLITTGEQVLYALAIVDDLEPRLFSLLASELEEMDSRFTFIEYHNETIPILRQIK